LLSLTLGLELDIQNETSIKEAASTIAGKLISLYPNGGPDAEQAKVGLFEYPPYYWWQSGAAWGGLVDYAAYTGDTQYVETTTTALLAQTGPDNDYMVPEHKFDEGNDDQAFWGLALLNCIENGFPNPPPSTGKPSWLQLVEALINTQTPRWDMGSCGGGLKWQIYPENDYGYNYKNAISNGAYFQMAARLARYTGNTTYIEWANKAWNWSEAIGLISPSFQVFDGTDDKKNCSDLNHLQFSYNVAVYLHGAAHLYNISAAHDPTSPDTQTWSDRTRGLLVSATSTFFTPAPNATDIMYEAACEPYDTCNTDMRSFKAYMFRWLAKASLLFPDLAAQIRPLIETNARAAATSCSGGDDGVTCGHRWDTGDWDGMEGLGEQMSALEAVQALLVANGGAPRKAGNVTDPAVRLPGPSEV
ncbi:mannan endo-1,6-alpha-mannosidase-like protein DCW1 precursor, partial [Eremomyces bilateralis CBS 781.70]